MAKCRRFVFFFIGLYYSLDCVYFAFWHFGKLYCFDLCRFNNPLLRVCLCFCFLHSLWMWLEIVEMLLFFAYILEWLMNRFFVYTHNKNKSSNVRYVCHNSNHLSIHKTWTQVVDMQSTGGSRHSVASNSSSVSSPPSPSNDRLSSSYDS